MVFTVVVGGRGVVGGGEVVVVEGVLEVVVVKVVWGVEVFVVVDGVRALSSL